MSKTVKELADELGVSKQTIRYHYRNIPDKYVVKGQDGVIRIDPIAEGIIRNKVVNNHHKNTGKYTDKDSEFTGKEKYDDHRNILVEQLAKKDEEIKRLHSLLEQAQKIADQSQQLQLMAEHKLKKLSVPQNEPDSESKPVDSQIHEQDSEFPRRAENSPENKGSFWHRLFGVGK
ncbi:helix-turn-helix transcriptional regulator [Lacticaseibacillus paracasei]|uniref:helix-turn-helix transcriptional regulator n=1 Tax=Lacticaseibacillus paracasei TaxID=1597 RepID=UPI0021C38278|nr:helix-turn-helix domain-containing protein [Lacticaseibacillus paracasei]MCP9380093.1 replication protein B [Lacticaseibacillus paracasei]